MAWKPLQASAVSAGGKKRGCYILKKLCEAWNCQPQNAVGACGCFYCESTCDPAAYNKAEKAGKFKGSAANGAGYGAGIAQWSLSWKASIQKMFGNYSPIESWSLDQQIQIVLKTCKPNFVNKLKQCSNARDSTDIWLRGYENGGGGSGGLCSVKFIDKYTWCNGYYGAMQHRVTAANEILKAYMGGEVGADILGSVSNFSGSTDDYGGGGGGGDYATAGGDNGVLAPSTDNIYSNFLPKESDEEKAKHTRIYQAFGPGTKVDQMQMNVDGTVPTVDNTPKADGTNTPSGSTTTGNTTGSGNTTTSTGATGNTGDGAAKQDSATTTPGDSSTGSTPSTNGTAITPTSGSGSTGSGSTSDGDGKTVTVDSDTEDKPTNAKTSVSDEAVLEVGVTYPVIRINDYYIPKESIEYFEVTTVNFVPTAKLIFSTRDSNIMKQDTIKDGDIMAVFMAPTSSMYKSLRCDFLITQFKTPVMSQQFANAMQTYTIYAELYVPNLYNANMTFAYSGSSRDAIMYAAEQLKLGFNFNDPENTDDSQMWYCTTETEGDELSSADAMRPSNIKEFIISTASHSWKNFESFFNCWIDPRYAITFLNVNKQLVENGPDEPLDAMPRLNAVMQNRGAEGSRSTKNPEDEKKEAAAGKGPTPQAKLLTNVVDGDESGTVMYVTDYKVVNQAGEISRQMGVNIQKSYVIDNLGVDNNSNSVTMNYSIPYNEWKLKHGFYIQIGPGKNESYVPGDSFKDFVRTNVVKQGGMTTDMQADTDGETIEATGDNMEATGAVNKFYDAGAEHNRINNLQLQKKYVLFTLNGANFGIMRGEKIPAIIIDNNQITNSISIQEGDNNVLMKMMYEEASGWFIIDSIEWVYDPGQGRPEAKTGSPWRTIVKCIRREWPISGNAIAPDAAKESGRNNPENSIVLDPTAGNSVESKIADTNEETVQDPSTGGQEPSEGSTSEGLQPALNELMTALSAKIPGTQMYQGRIWAANENKEKCDGLPYITDGGCYEFINSDGSWGLTTTSKGVHFTGWAMNVQNANMEPDALLKEICQHVDLLEMLYKGGLSCYIESHKTSVKSWKTLHIGADTLMQGTFWEYAIKAAGDAGKQFSDFRSYNHYTEPQRPNEVKRSDLDQGKKD